MHYFKRHKRGKPATKEERALGRKLKRSQTKLAAKGQCPNRKNSGCAMVYAEVGSPRNPTGRYDPYRQHRMTHKHRCIKRRGHKGHCVYGWVEAVGPGGKHRVPRKRAKWNPK